MTEWTTTADDDVVQRDVDDGGGLVPVAGEEGGDSVPPVVAERRRSSGANSARRHSMNHPPWAPPTTTTDGLPPGLPPDPNPNPPPNPSSRLHSLLAPSYGGRDSLYHFSNSYDLPSYFSFDLSTQENYGSEDEEFYGPFRGIRSELDFVYHGNYKEERQAFQDRIIAKLLDKTEVADSETGAFCKTPTEPWIVFTAGVMGAGKGYAMKQLSSKDLFPWKSYIVVDPDEIRSHFAEYHIYARFSPREAGNLTHREAGYIAEIMTEVATQKGYNVLVDGSLWDHEWYEEYFGTLREKYPILRIAILHITAPREAVLERAASRAKATGRVVPVETLENSLRQVPVSVKKLAPMADFFAELDNSSGEVSMMTEGITWDSFRDNWAQSCPWVPGQERVGT